MYEPSAIDGVCRREGERESEERREDEDLNTPLAKASLPQEQIDGPNVLVFQLNDILHSLVAVVEVDSTNL